MKITITIEEGKHIDVTVNDGRDGLPKPTLEEVNEDRCKWKTRIESGEGTRIVSPHMSHVSMEMDLLEMNPFCGHCGKRIEVVQ